MEDEDKPAARSIINEMTEMPDVDHLSDDEWKTFKSIVFWRTTGCMNYHGAGKHCTYGANCLFAHGKVGTLFPLGGEEDEQDYRYKTKKCYNGDKCYYSGCSFAHSNRGASLPRVLRCYLSPLLFHFHLFTISKKNDRN